MFDRPRSAFRVPRPLARPRSASPPALRTSPASPFPFARFIPAPPASFAALVCALALIAPAALVATEISAAPPSPLSPRLAGTPFLRTWQAEDYEAGPVNWDVAVHPNNFIYVGNNAGVLEFDGARWRTLPMPHGGRAACVAIDPQGRVWAGGHDEIARFDPDARGALRAVDLASVIGAENLPLGSILQIVAAPDGIYLRNPLRIFRLRETSAGWQARVWRTNERFTALWRLGDSVCANTAQGFVRFDGDEMIPVAAPLGGTAAAFGPNPRPVLATRVDPDGTHVLLCTIGPMRWRGPGTAIAPLSPQVAEIFTNESAQAATFLPDGRMAFAMTRSGLLILDAHGRVQQRFDRTHGLPHNRFEALAPDAQGGIWVALHYGLARLQLDTPFALHGAAQGVEGGSRRFARQWDRLFVTNGEGVSWREATTGRFHPVEGVRLGGNRLLPLGDRLLLSSGGLKEITSDNRARPHWNGVLYAVVASQLHPGWVFGSSTTGLILFKPADRPDGPGWEMLGRVHALRIDIENVHDTGDGFVWVATQAGEIWRADFRRGLRLDAPVERFGPDRGVPAVQRSENIQLFNLGPALCASSSDWLLRFDPAAGRFVPETRIPGLGAGRGAAVVHVAASGAIWFCATKDRAEFLRATPTADGWRTERHAIGPLRNLIVNSVLEDPADRTLWIAGQGALVSLDFAWRPLAPLPPLRVHVRQVETPGGAVLFSGTAASTRDGPPASLDSSRRALRFEFAAPAHTADFSGRLRTHYRTWLEGFDEDWTLWSQETHRDFTELPFRALRFRVQARDLHGRVSLEDSFAFVIAPPWWRTGWAYGGCAVACALAVSGIVVLRTRALQRRARRLEEIVGQRTGELATQNRELARLHQLELDEKTAARLAEEKARLEMLRYQLNPHFLYNALGSIRSLVHSRPAEADEMTMQLADFCRMTLTRTDRADATLGDEITMISAYLDMERTRWRERLATRIDVDPALLGAHLPPFVILPLVENAIKYGTRTSEEIVRVEIAVRRDPHRAALEIEVANTGRWIDPAAASTAHHASTGIGLENLRQRLQRYYPDSHAFTITASDGWVRVRLRLANADSANEGELGRQTSERGVSNR